jgi:hypothetical protein
MILNHNSSMFQQGPPNRHAHGPIGDNLSGACLDLYVSG